MRNRVFRVVSLAMALAMAAVGAWAGGLDAPSPVVTVEGRAAIYHNDVAGARERAVRAALVRGLERYAGLRIEASTLIKKGELIDREVRAHTHGYVRSFEVLDEHREGEELVVKVRVHVAPAPVEESFARMLSATTTLLLIRERNLGAPIHGRIVPAVLTGPFFTASLVVPGEAVLRSAAAKVPERFFEDPDPATVRELGLRYLAGIVVAGWADTKQLDTSPGSLGYEVDPSVLRPVVAASGNLAILDGRTGKLIASRRFDDVRGSDATDPKRAGLEALGTLAGQMRHFLVEALSAHVEELGFHLQVTVTGKAAADGAPAVRQILEDTRWVRHVTIASEAPGKTVLQVDCTENPVYVVEELRQSPEITLRHFDAAAGTVELR